MSEAEVVQSGSKALRCYDFTVTNTTQLPVTDVHIPIGEDTKTDIPPSGPEGWQGRHDADGITFETPPQIPPRKAGETRPRPMPPSPIPPGKRLAGFTFYLSGPAETEGMFFTFPNIEETEEGSVEQGGTIIKPSESGTVHPTGMIYCHAVTITAPKDSPIYIVRLKANKPLLHGGTKPAEGWSTNTSNTDGQGVVHSFPIGNRDPISPGESRVFTVYSKFKKLNIDWTLFDKSWGLLDEGELDVKFS